MRCAGTGRVLVLWWLPLAVAAAVPQPRTGAELSAAVQTLTAAGDVEGLMALCRDLSAKAFPEDPGAATTLALCRGRALQGLRRGPEAVAAYQEVIRLSAGGALAGTHVAQVAASEARYRLGELAEQTWREHQPCLRELGIFWGSRREAQEHVALFKDADRVYRNAIASGRAPWPARAAFRITAMHVDFYRGVSRHTAPNFRGLNGPPPLASARVEAAEEALRLVLDPARSEWPRVMREVAEAAGRRARDNTDDPELATQTAALLRQVQDLGPPPRAPMGVPFPPRGGDTRGYRAVRPEREAVTLEKQDGTRVREPVLAQGKLLVDMVKGGAAERFAPEAAVALGLGGYRAAMGVLRDAAQSADAELAVAAVFALGELGAEPEVALLLRLYAAAQPHGDGPEVFSTPSAALFGMRERVLEALIKLARREPRAVEKLMSSTLPQREAAYVLFHAAHKDLRPVLAQYARHTDDVVATYHALGMASLSSAEGRTLLKELSSRRGAACWAAHGVEALGPAPLRPEALPFPTTTGTVIP